MNKKNQDKSLLISDLIRQVHNELIKSQLARETEGLDPLFEVDSLTIEANFVVRTASDASAGFKFEIITVGGIEVGAGKEFTREEVHKIVLNLKRVPATGKSGLKKMEVDTPGMRPRRTEE